jgi:hypothetical protein
VSEVGGQEENENKKIRGKEKNMWENKISGGAKEKKNKTMEK